jgi:dihydrofolate reductase
VYIATSLDGFIARKDGGIDWLSGPWDAPGGQPADLGFDAFFATIDALVMGRNTFDLVLTFPEWYYAEKQVVVLTSREVEIPEKLAGRVRVMSGPPREVVEALSELGYKHLYVDGGVTIQRFLDAGMIDRLIISRLPVIIGSGLPLFGPTSSDIWLQHVSTRVFEGGLVQSEYKVERGGKPATVPPAE